MPSGCVQSTGVGCLTSGEQSRINSWRLGGTPRWLAPSTTTQNESAVTNSSATLNSSTDPQGAATTVTYTYALNNTLTSSPVTTAGTAIGSGGDGSTASAPRAISGLNCGTRYYYRSNASNSRGSDNGNVLFLDTTACSNPTLSITGVGSATDQRITLAKSTTFTQASLTFVTNDVDTSVATWNFGTPTAGSLSGVNTSTGAFTYNAPAAAQLASFTVSVTDNDPATGGGPNTSSTVTVYIDVTDSAPEFRTAAFPGGSVITMDSLTVDEDGNQALGMFAYDSDLDTINWEVFSGPSDGTLGSLASATGTINSISYTPDPDFDTSDSFVIRITDGSTPSTLTVNVNVTPDPDNPVATDDGPITFDIGVPVAISVLTNDFDVDTGDAIAIDPGSIIGVSAGSAAVSISSDTQIKYTSSLTQFTNDTFRYAVIDDSPGTLRSGLATVSLEPRDSDGDGVINYLDNCPATPNAGQADNDNDSGTFVNNNNLADPVQDIVTPDRVVNIAPGSSPGGDACDVDDDNDGMHDDYEDANSLDSFTDDSGADNDGDGVSNYDELVNGTNPNQPDLVIDATGYFTPFELTPPNPKAVHTEATAVTPVFADPLTDSTDPNGPYRPGINDILWLPSNGSDSDLTDPPPGTPGLLQTPPVQTLRIRPLVSFATDQQVVEGGTASVQVTLNGVSPSWPGTDASVAYTVSGTATNPADHDATGGTITFVDQDFTETITVNTVADGLADPNETIVLTFTPISASNVAIGAQSTHEITIVEGNLAPQGTVTFSQGGPDLATAYANVNGGIVDINLNPTDANGDTLSYDWSRTDNALVPVLPVIATATTPTLAPGNYLVDVTITDDGSPTRSTRVTRILRVEVAAPDLTGDTDDSDGDGNDNENEGYGDSDGDGVPDYLDAQDGAVGGSNLVPDQTVNMSNIHLLESTPGTTLTRGLSAEAAGRFGALLTDDDIEQFGSNGGTAPLNGDDALDHATGIYDFEVRGLVPGATANIVIPLQTGIPKNAVYRKFSPATGWRDFVVDSNNRIASAVGEQGACPEPGSDLYTNGLTYLDNCIQLTIRDGGPNDNDGVANGVIADPGTTGISLSDPEIEEVEEGASRVSPVLILVLMLVGGLAAGRKLGGVARLPVR